MAPSPTHWARALVHKPSLILALLCLIGTACSTTDQNAKIIFEDPRGTVSLQTIPDRSIQATHPITLEPTLIAQILRGIEVQDQERGLQKILGGSSSPVPVFSDDQIRFLAPLLAEGLRTAAPDQRIGYRVETRHKGSFLESSTTETTSGSLYAYGRQLYVTLSQYRYSPERTNLNIGDMANRSRPLDYSGLRNRILLFTPSVAQRSDAFDLPTGEKPTDRFLAIDYELLQQAPAATATDQGAPQMGRTSPTRESAAGTRAPESPTPSTEALAQEVEALKKEMQSLKQQQLGNQTNGPDSPKQKTSPPLGPKKPTP
ncbi:MAG: hypothetical protein EHM80_16385 [Nitrospiraceae bacterium]|nr:MAG: hypothetical protein EHM80_16385 [Nitrospiraceae bacterium]